MNKKKIFKIATIIVIAGILIGGGIGAYLFFMPHRDVQTAKTDVHLTSTAIVEEYLF